MVGRVRSGPGAIGFADGAGQAVSAHSGDAPSRDVAALIRTIEALSFYAIAENWHGVYMVGRGPMTDDWGDVDDGAYPDGKPGKLARETIAWLIAQYPCDSDRSGEAIAPATQIDGATEGESAGPQGIAQSIDPIDPVVRRARHEGNV